MKTVRWNTNMPHRCPECHAVAVDLERPRSWGLYTCCRCTTRFARWPSMTPLLRRRGVMCSEHRKGDA